MPGRNQRRKKDELGPASAGQSGDLQQLSDVPEADSESVEELMEEGNALEADAVEGVEHANPPDVSEVRTREVPEDDVPAEYLDNKRHRLKTCVTIEAACTSVLRDWAIDSQIEKQIRRCRTDRRSGTVLG
jgi:hypothetical protein